MKDMRQSVPRSGTLMERLPGCSIQMLHIMPKLRLNHDIRGLKLRTPRRQPRPQMEKPIPIRGASP